MNSAGTSESEPSAHQRGTWQLVAIVLGFVGLATALVPRLTNVHFGDIEFSGWSGPLGSRLLAGDVPYEDFTLPIPPGSFALLAAIERWSGRPLLIHELWLNAALHVALGALAYALARTLTSRAVALGVAASTLVAMTYLNKECAYDHTAQVTAWGTVVAATRALVADGTRRRWWWATAGLAAGLTLAFKQSTALGALAAAGMGVLYSAWRETGDGEPVATRTARSDAASTLVGAATGIAIVIGLLFALGSTPAAFVTAVFRDGSALKGGTPRLLGNLWGYFAAYGVFPPSLAFIGVLTVLGAKVHRGEGFDLGLERERRDGAWVAWTVAAAALGTFAAAHVWLRAGAPLGPSWVGRLDFLKHLPGLGIALAMAFAAGVRLDRRADPATPAQSRHRTAFEAVTLMALAATVLHNTSAPEFRPFYDNNVLIPVGFLHLYVALTRARARIAGPVVFSLALASLFGNKLHRAVEARRPAPAGTHWAGLSVSESGTTMARMAQRVRSLTSDGDTVLVLPEDVQVAALIGRPRPRLRGAIAFVDQYPVSVLEHDLAVLEREPPKVVVIHPREPHQWVRFYRIWTVESPAELLLRHVLSSLLPSRYERVASYETKFQHEPATLDVWVRRP